MDLQRLETYVRLRKEDPKVDLKWQLCLDSKKRRIEFAIDVASIVNSKSVDHRDPNGYLILGVPDAKAEETPPRSPTCAPYGDPDEERVFNQQIQQCVDIYCDPPVDVSYREIRILGKLIGLITLFTPPVLPVFIHNTGRGDLESTVWVRSGKGHPGKRHAKISEIREFFLDYLRTLNPYMSDEEWNNYEDRLTNLLRSSEIDRIAVLATELVQRDADRRARACRALGEISGLEDDTERLAGQLLIGVLHDDERSVQWEAIRSLSQLRDRRAISPLGALYSEDEPELAMEIIGALQGIGGPTAIQTLGDLYSEDKPELAMEIIGAFQAIGGPTAIQTLGDLYSEGEPELATKIIVALYTIGGLTAIQAIQALQGLYSEDEPELATQIIGAVQGIGGPPAVQAIQSIREETDDEELRDQAGAALIELTA